MLIPYFVIKDKQAFIDDESMLRLLGNPIELAKRYRKGGYKLLHIIDADALKGLSRSLDIYDKLTFFINVQVECANDERLVRKLLSLKCRVVLPPDADTSAYREKSLLVAKIPGDYEGEADAFRDVILQDAKQIRRFTLLGKRVMVYGKTDVKVWGSIIRGD